MDSTDAIPSKTGLHLDEEAEAYWCSSIAEPMFLYIPSLKPGVVIQAPENNAQISLYSQILVLIT